MIDTLIRKFYRSALYVWLAGLLQNTLQYINGSESLPPPLTEKEEEELLHKLEMGNENGEEME